MNFIPFIIGSIKIIFHGSKTYFAWLLLLLILIIWGGYGYSDQLTYGLIKTHMRDSVSWAFYIGNLTDYLTLSELLVELIIKSQ